MTTSDLVLLAYIFLIVPAMLVGFVFARRKMFEPYHKYTMTAITIVNWLLIIFVMLVTYRRDVIPFSPEDLKLPGILIPTVHLIPGLIAQLLATYLVIRMWFSNVIPERLAVANIKPYMRATLALWLVTAVLGVVTWAVFNRGFLSSPSAAGNAAPNVVQLVAGNKFDPPDLSIKTGTTVQFVNADTKPHTVNADDGSFASGPIKPGAAYTHTFGQPGDIPYYCDFHGKVGHVGMAAVIHVAGSPVAVATDSPTSTAAATSVATSAATENAAAPKGSVFTVELKDDFYSPKEITIPVGATVHFVNKGTTEHTATADDGSFDSDQISVGASFDQAFPKAGTVPLYCTNHGESGGKDMSMVIHVVAGGAAQNGTQSATQAP